MNNFSKLQALTGSTHVVKSETTPNPESSWYSKPRHLYEGTDSEDDEDVTSGRVATKSFPSSESQQVVAHPAPPAPTYASGHVEYEFEVGQLAPKGESFCPFQIIKKYPYTYIGVANRKKVEEGFFAQGKLYENSWDIFYIYREPSDPNQQPVQLVPTRQFEHFLDAINRKLRTNLKIPTGGQAFKITFSQDGTPQPRYLGRVLTKEMAENLKWNVPSSNFKLDNEPDAVAPSEKALNAFRKKIELLHQGQKRKKSNKQDKQKQVEKKRHWNHSIKRVQRYLGLRAVGEDNIANPRAGIQGSDLEWPDYDATVKAAAAKLPPTAIFDPDRPATFDQDGSVVFICVDVEAYERDTKNITEIGIATLDTRDIISMSPGEGGKNWMIAIRPRHFRIKEHKHLNNTEFVSGCADRFEFGESEFISLADAPYVVSTCFKHPFSKPGIEAIEENPKRKIVLVGHDTGSDISFLRTLGYDVSNLSNLQEVVDTAIMWKYLKRELNPRKLGSILADLDITSWNLHNAGNDAVYTLKAMVAIAIKHLKDREKEKDLKDPKKDIDFGTTKQVSDTALNKEEGWSTTGNNSDGGNPVLDLPVPPATKKSPTVNKSPFEEDYAWLKSTPRSMATTSSTTAWLQDTHAQASKFKSTAQPWTFRSETPDDVLNSSWDTPDPQASANRANLDSWGEASAQHDTSSKDTASTLSRENLAKLEKSMNKASITDTKTDEW